MLHCAKIRNGITCTFMKSLITQNLLHFSHYSARLYSREEWLSVKNTLGLAFPNVGVAWTFKKYDLSLHKN